MKGAFFYSFSERLSAGSDRSQRIVDFMHDSRSQPADRRQLFGAGNRAIGFDSRGNVLANRDHLRDSAATGGAHGNLADQPVIGFATLRHGLLFDAANLSSGENFGELAFEHLATLLRQDLKDIPPHYLAARQAQLAQFAVAVPRHDSIVAIDRIERERQAVNDRFGEALLHLGFDGAALDFLSQGRGGFSRAEIEQGNVRGQRGPFRPGAYKSTTNL